MLCFLQPAAVISLYCCVLRMFFHKDKYKRQRSSLFTFTPEIYGSFSFRQAQKLIERRLFYIPLKPAVATN
jgi:hypothetical protein